MTNPNQVAAQSLQEKFELYLLGLAFTLVGLAIQTAKFEGPPPQRIAELIGWILLLLSGLVGLRRLQWVPSLLRYGAERQRLENEVFELRSAPAEALVEAADGVISAGDLVANRKKNIEKIEAKETPLGAKIAMMGEFQTWTFVAGICAVGIARAYLPVSELVAALCR